MKNIILISLVSIFLFAWVSADDWVSIDNPVICTMDAKQCSDGSYVSRTGPNCEFTKCPWDVEVTPINPVICTADAKQCSDGSYVSRAGPNCEFSKCSWDVEIIPNNISVYKISHSNKNTYTEIKNTVSLKKQRLIDRFILKIENKLVEFSDYKKEKFIKAIIFRLDKKISDLVIEYSTIELLPDNINNKYSIFTLLKFELNKLIK